MGSNPTLSATFFAAALALLAACQPRPQSIELAGPTMGTTYSVVLPRLPPHVTRTDAEAAIADVLGQVDRHLSGWAADSELARFNAADGTDWVAISPILLAAVEEAQVISRATGGAFDVTVGPAVRAWGFGAGADDEPPPPSDAELQRLLAGIGFGKLEARADPPGLRKAVPGLDVDLDGIAPGWAVDRIAERFEALGIDDYLVELGGEVRARGQSAAGRPWRVAVEAPLAGERKPYAIVELDGVGVSTSGDYRDFREIDGRRVSHTIDPRTARPVRHGLASVTVIHPSVAAADAWATALMVLGPDAGLALARERRLPALIIERGERAGEFTTTATDEFERFRRTSGPGL